MDVEVIPIAITQVDMDTYRRLNPVPSLDTYYIKPDTLLGYLASLIKEGDPRQGVRDLEYILKHISISFVIRARDLNDIRYFTELALLELREETFLLTGTLGQWKKAAIDLCNRAACTKTRYALNCCVLYIEKAGLQDVFGNYGKQTLPDKTFILQRKE